MDGDCAAFGSRAGREVRALAFQGKRKWYRRDDRFDDGAKITARVGRYRPNAWGLCDMAGNVCEWTLTTYRAYPYDPSDGRHDAPGDKVVRGGSWYDKPNRARSAFRWKYPAWMKVHNVGFRVWMQINSATPAETT